MSNITTRVKILVDGSFVETDGIDVSPTWAATQCLGGSYWTVTHLPTGCGLGARFPRRGKRAAVAMAKAIEARFPAFEMKRDGTALATFLADAP